MVLVVDVRLIPSDSLAVALCISYRSLNFSNVHRPHEQQHAENCQREEQLSRQAPERNSPLICNQLVNICLAHFRFKAATSCFMSLMSPPNRSSSAAVFLIASAESLAIVCH